MPPSQGAYHALNERELAPMGSSSYPRLTPVAVPVAAVASAATAPPMATSVSGPRIHYEQNVPVADVIASAPPQQAAVPTAHLVSVQQAVGVPPPPAALPPAAMYPAQVVAQRQGQMPQPRPAVPQGPPAGFALFTPGNPSPEEFGAGIEERRAPFSTMRYLKEGTTFYTKNFCTLTGVTISYACILLAAAIVFGVVSWFAFEAFGADMQGAFKTTNSFMNHTNGNWWDNNWGSDGNVDFAALKPQLCDLVSMLVYLVVVYVLVLSFVGYPLIGAYFNAVFNSFRSNGPVSCGDFFCCANGFGGCGQVLRLMGLGLLTVLLTFLLCLLFIIPGVWFSVASVFAVPLLVEQQHLSIMDAIRTSCKIVNRNWCASFCFLLILHLMNSMWFLMVATVPWTLVIFCYSYAHQIGVNGMPVYISTSQFDHVAANPVAHAPGSLQHR